MIDLHCHLLPGIDDGPQDMAGTLDMARAHLVAGVTTVAATPHVDWNYANRPPRITEVAAATRTALGEAELGLEVVESGEIAMSLAIDLADEELHALRLGGGDWILLECPLSPLAVGLDRIVPHLQERGYRILLAHPERSPVIHKTPDLLVQLVADGALTQLTAGSFTGQFGGAVRAFSLQLASRGLVHTVASDAHDTTTRVPGLREPLESAGLGAYVELWCETNPRAILDGADIPPSFLPPPVFEEPHKRRRLRLR